MEIMTDAIIHFKKNHPRGACVHAHVRGVGACVSVSMCVYFCGRACVLVCVGAWGETNEDLSEKEGSILIGLPLPPSLPLPPHPSSLPPSLPLSISLSASFYLSPFLLLIRFSSSRWKVNLMWVLHKCPVAVNVANQLLINNL